MKTAQAWKMAANYMEQDVERIDNLNYSQLSCERRSGEGIYCVERNGKIKQTIQPG